MHNASPLVGGDCPGSRSRNPSEARIKRHEVAIGISDCKGKKKRPSDDGRFSLSRGYEKDVFCGLH